jgi:hypothetical protein
MTQFLFSYRVPKTPLWEVLGELTEEQRASRIAAWNGWFDSMGANVLERGQPVGAAHEVGNCDGEMRVGGYSLVAAESLEQALYMAEGCPGVAWGGGVEVGELLELPLAPPTPEPERETATTR